MKIKILYGTIILLLIVIISLLFLKGENQNEDAAYKKGIQTGLDLIMRQAKNENCDTIDIKRDDEEIKLINIMCLNQEVKK